MSDRFYAADTPAQLLARITNYEEGMHEVVVSLGADEAPEAKEAVQILSALMCSTGEAHLRALTQFEESTSAIIAFKDRVLESLCKEGCPACGGIGAHTPDCLVGAALRVHPHALPQVLEDPVMTLGTLWCAVARISKKVSDEEIREELVQALSASPITGDLQGSH